MIDADTLRRVVADRYGGDRIRVARAPGRVNLIGEHTDYNDGYVFPAAIDRYVSVAFSARDDGVLRGYSMDFGTEDRASFDELAPVSERPTWFDYAAGVAWVYRQEGTRLEGMDFIVSGDVPIGAGLSSSAALELAVARALADVSSVPWDGRHAALAGQRVENDYIGLKSGIMDQMASALCCEGEAMLLDCRNLSFESVSIPGAIGIVVMDTGTRRSLAGSEYNDRRASCERVVRVVAEARPEVVALRDVREAEVEACRSRLDAIDYRRALHVVQENARTLEMARALRLGDRGAIRELMAGSHRSLRDLYEVSSPELDEIVALAAEHPACWGARMTGAGFGGCAVALVEGASARSRAVTDFVDHVRRSYSGAAELYPCRAVGGASLVKL